MSLWLDQNYNWTQQMIIQNPNDIYWMQIQTMFSQLKGIVDGCNDHSPSDKQITIQQLYFVKIFFYLIKIF